MFKIIKDYEKKSNSYYILAFLIILILCSCDKNTCSVDDRIIADKFEIHLQQHFNNTYVYLKIDDKSIFSGEVNTDYIINLAAIISPQIENGYHTIQTYIETNMADTSFTVQDSLVITITYDESQNNISFYFCEPPNFPIYE